jgi:hypothetical protein
MNKIELKSFIILYEASYGKQVRRKVRSTCIEGAIIRVCKKDLIHENAILNVVEL